MNSGLKKLYWVGVAAVFLLLLLCALAFILPRFVDSTWLKEKIRTEVASQVKGEFDFQGAELNILPTPSVALKQVSLSIPATASIHLETLKIYPDILPLLLGKIKLENIVIDAPDFSLPLPQKSSGRPNAETLSGPFAFLETVSSSFPPVLEEIPNLDIGIKQGTLRLFSGDSQIILVENLNGEFKIKDQSLSATISSFTAFQQNGKIIAKLEKLKGKIHYSDQVTEMTVEDFSLSYPQVQLRGTYIFDQKIPHASLDISSQKVNIAEIHEILPDVIKLFNGDLPAVRKISDQIREGTISQTSLHVEGKSAADLTVFESIHFQAHVADGEILLSDLGLDLQEVTGDVIMTNGIFEGKDFQARITTITDSDNASIQPLKSDSLFLLNTFSISAIDKILRINSALIQFEGQDYTIDGKASMAQEGLSFDLNVLADAIELDKILTASKKENELEISETGAVETVALAVNGTINIQANSLQYNSYTWEHFKSVITLENNMLTTKILAAELCGISTPGVLTLQNGEIALDFTLEAVGRELKEILICLEGGTKQMTGALNLDATVKGKGNRETLRNSLEGNLYFSSADGYIYKDAKLAKLLYILDVSHLFQGKIPDLANTGFHYDSLIVKGVMEEGILTVTPARLDAPIMEISAYGTIDIPREKVAFQVLVAPLQTINKIQKLLPIISVILPESLVAVPIDVKGDFSDIEVNTMSMSAISKNIFNNMFNALSTPVRVLTETSEEEK